MDVSEIRHSDIHAKAVEIGRESSVPSSADRLASANPDRFIDDMIRRIKADVIEPMTKDEVIENLANRLWVGWLEAELAVAEGRSKA